MRIFPSVSSSSLAPITLDSIPSPHPFAPPSKELKPSLSGFGWSSLASPKVSVE